MQQAGREDHILDAWGPERIDTGWWRDGPIGRDYFRVTLTGGHHLWIYRDHARRQWFLQGVFD
jgi:protein ImuB